MGGGIRLPTASTAIGVSTPRIHVRPGNPDFLDLDWEASIAQWAGDPLVEMPTGVHRHPVVFAAYPEGIYAIKELPERYARNEFDSLRKLEQRTTRSARPVGLVTRDWVDTADEHSAAVITRYVEHAFPYIELVQGGGFGTRRDQMLDAFAGLLVELHLAGCYWGDCSLSNVLYRYDAGALEAVMIDGETTRIYPSLSAGQRLEDIQIMTENLAGEMADIAASEGAEVTSADLAIGEDIGARYHALWSELTEVLVIGKDERFLIRQRIERLNDLGFSVGDVDLIPAEEGTRVRMRVEVGGRTFHTDRLRQLAGVEASENQARLLLSDLNYYLAATGGVTASGKTVGTMRWRSEVLEPILDRIEAVYRGNPIQGFCDLLHFRLQLAQQRGQDVPNEEAMDLWLTAGMPGFPLGPASDGSGDH